MRYLIPLIIFLILGGFLAKSLKKDPHQLQSALIGKPVRAFSYPDLLDSQKKLTNRQFLGHVSLLNIWATWCISCKAEHPILMDIARSSEVALYGLNYKDNAMSAHAWLEKFGNPYLSIISDPTGTLAIDFGVYGTPETFLIDARGIIRYRHIGAISPDDWKNTLEPLVRKWSGASN